MSDDQKSQTSVEASGLSKVYWDGSRSLEIFSHISLTVKKGQGVAILGPSGSGKTTLLNILSGLDRPTNGQVKLQGILMNELGDKDRAAFINKNLGFVFQFYHLLSEFTALENVMLPALLPKKPIAKADIRKRAEALLEKVGLKDRTGHFPGELSGGEQQRVAIARALMNDPEILFCDEPTGNLDKAMGQGVAEILMDLYRKENKTVLVVTHDERIANMADSVWDILSGNWSRRKA